MSQLQEVNSMIKGGLGRERVELQDPLFTKQDLTRAAQLAPGKFNDYNIELYEFGINMQAAGSAVSAKQAQGILLTHLKIAALIDEVPEPQSSVDPAQQIWGHLAAIEDAMAQAAASHAAIKTLLMEAGA